MRKYIKPTLRVVNLNLSVLIATSSGTESQTVETSGTTAGTFEILSNKESEHDIWGDDSSSMWK